MKEKGDFIMGGKDSPMGMVLELGRGGVDNAYIYINHVYIVPKIIVL